MAQVNVSPSPNFMKRFKNVGQTAKKFSKKSKKASKTASKLVRAMRNMKSMNGNGMSDNDGDE